MGEILVLILHESKQIRIINPFFVCFLFCYSYVYFLLLFRFWLDRIRAAFGLVGLLSHGGRFLCCWFVVRDHHTIADAEKAAHSHTHER